MRLLQTFDQVDLLSLAGAEWWARAMVQTEMAVRRNPKPPDYTGLEVMKEGQIDLSGAASVPHFDTWVVEQQKAKG